MTGIGDNNGPAFDKAATDLRAMGYAVCNPNETDQILGPLSFERYMRFDFARVLEADFLVALPQWERSRGALAEILVAIRIDTPVWGWENWSDYDRIREHRVNAAIADLYSGRTVTVSHEAKQKAKDQISPRLREILDEGRAAYDEAVAWQVGPYSEVRDGPPSTSDSRGTDSVVRQATECMGVFPDGSPILYPKSE
jgi:hypothetical protein